MTQTVEKQEEEIQYSQADLERLETLAVMLAHVSYTHYEASGTHEYRSWEDCPQDLKEMYISHVKFIEALSEGAEDTINNGTDPNHPQLIETLCTFLYEHGCKFKEQSGWTYGEAYDLEAKTDPSICQWYQVDVLEKARYRNMVRAYMLLKYTTKQNVINKKNNRIFMLASACFESVKSYNFGCNEERNKECDWDVLEDYQREFYIKVILFLEDYSDKCRSSDNTAHEMISGVNTLVHKLWVDVMVANGWQGSDSTKDKFDSRVNIENFEDLYLKDKQRVIALTSTYYTLKDFE